MDATGTVRHVGRHCVYQLSNCSGSITVAGSYMLINLYKLVGPIATKLHACVAGLSMIKEDTSCSYKS